MFVTQSLGKGGAEKLVLDISNTFKRLFPDVRVKIVALSELNLYTEISIGLDIAYCNSSVTLSVFRKNIVDISEYEKIVDSFQPDVVHSHTYKAELVSRENPRRGIKYFTHVHSDIPEFEPFHPASIFSKAALARFFERSRIFIKYKKINNQFITISNAVDQQLREQLPAEWQKNIHLLNNAIDFKRFSKYELPEFPRERINIVSVGRLTAIKNYPFQLRVLQELIKRDKRFFLTIVGDGLEEQSLKTFAAELKVSSNVCFMHNTNDIPEVLSTKHIYIHTALKEGFSLSTLEAMAAGLPVICLDAGGNRDLVVDGKNGFILLQETSPVAFAEQLLKLSQNQQLYEEMSFCSRKFASNFDIETYCTKLHELYSRKN